MATQTLFNATTPATPASGYSVVFADLTTKKFGVEDDSGIVRGIISANQMVAASGNANAADTYVTNSGIQVPTCGIQVGQLYYWRLHLSKTAAGTAALVVTFRLGANQSTADTSVVALTQTIAQAATADSGIFEASAYVAVSGASGIMACCFQPGGAASNLGGGKDGQSGATNLVGAASQYVGISINPGASGVWTWTGVWARLIQ